tara:strand:- start:407 stop:595 length:189 start_codon:yes stop_codon:yes gene_type:complete
MKDQLIAALASYARAGLACLGALWMSGITDPKVLANAFIAAALAPILRGVDPGDKKFGVGAN